MFLQQKYIAKYLFFLNVFSCFFVHFQEKWKKTGKMYNSDVLTVLFDKYESINERYADIDFFVHASASVGRGDSSQ